MNQTNASSYTPCELPNQKWILLLLIPIPVISGTINLVLWLAATYYRKKLLRQSYIYTSVTSTLLSNVLFLSLHLWDVISTYKLNDEQALEPPGSKMQLLWTLCTSAWIAMLSVVCGNITVSIYVMLDSTSIVTSVHNPTSASNKEEGKSKLITKKRRALLLLLIVWLLPFTLTLIAVLVWNCSKQCNCSPNAQGEVCPRIHGCSRVWPPMKNSFVAVNVGIWFLEVAVLVFVLIIVLKQNYRLFPQMKLRASGNIRVASIPEATNYDTSKMKLQQESKKDEKRQYQNQGFHINPRLRLAISLSVLFILCTIMIPITFFIDLAVDRIPTYSLRPATMAIIQIYTLVCPILLLKYLSSLKIVIERLASAILCCT